MNPEPEHPGYDGPQITLVGPVGIPGRLARPTLVDKLRKRHLTTAQGRAELLHTLAHIERNAIDLALNIVWRFAGLPKNFYHQWLQMAKKEALHFCLLRDHLRSSGYKQVFLTRGCRLCRRFQTHFQRLAHQILKVDVGCSVAISGTGYNKML